MNAKEPNKKSPFRPDFLVIFIIVAVVVGIFLFILNSQPQPQTLSWNELEYELNDKNIVSMSAVSMGSDNPGMFTVSGSLRDQSRYPGTSGFTINITIDELNTLRELVNAFNANPDNNTVIIPFEIVSRETFDWLGLILTLLTLAIPIVIIIFFLRSMNQSNNRAQDFGRSRAKLARGKPVKFTDVAGADEEKAEMEELIDFLKNPRKYVEMGARIPKGVLLVGPPGTGKTLLAKAVAGEAEVPFFTISGSDFVELYVGIGASRVRDLFRVAKENSPCILFIDEIDAVGRQRGAGLGGGNDEREQTLNQLLVEMDGFSANLGIIIIAATNRPDVLDPALLRPGRFDRQITMSLPDLKAREEILKVHCRSKRLDPTVKLSEVAMRIPGFSGADIENLLNEAALLAARANRSIIIVADIDEAIDRVILGPAKKSRKYSQKEKEMVAYHEAGHAVIGIKVEDANVVQKVTIIPRGRSGGYNLMIPSEETFLETKKSLLASITSFLGGRVAEELVFDTITTGAYDDFRRATAIARSMVTEYGMSELGPIQYESAGGSVFLGRDYLKDKNFSDSVAHEIDKAVRKIITECYDSAKHIIETNRSLLDSISKYLILVETLTKADIDEIVSTGKLAWWEEREAKNLKPSESPSEA